MVGFLGRNTCIDSVCRVIIFHSRNLTIEFFNKFCARVPSHAQRERERERERERGEEKYIVVIINLSG